MRRNLLTILLLTAVCLCACSAESGGSAGTTVDSGASAQDAAMESGENYDTGDPSLDAPGNQDGIGERELLVVSFGTSYNDARRLSIGAVEDALAAAFPDWSVRRAFTSQIVLDHVLSRDGVAMDNVSAALDRAVDNGVKYLAIQPTHLMDGFEYADLLEEVNDRVHEFRTVTIGNPLLTTDEDYSRTADAVRTALAEYDDGETALCLMGHGTEAASNAVYQKMQTVFAEKGMERFYVGTVEAEPSLEDVLAAVQAGNYRRVVLMPLMIVAGDHANNDMAGEEPDSWKSVFEAAGYEVVCVLRGLGELPEIQAIFADHAREAVDAANAAADGASADTEPADGTANAAETPDGASAGTERANGTAWTEVEQPVTAAELREGTYPVEVESSSSMFRVTACTLTTADGTMTAALAMGGTGYLYVYPGTAEEAAAASPDKYIPYTETADGTHVFTIPVPALNTPIPCAAFSRNREEWYDRTLTFRSNSLPPEAWAEEGDSVRSPLLPKDGIWTAEVTLSGGTGRASLSSPAVLTVRDGLCTARVEWSSSSYDFMTVDGERYLPVNDSGNSVFEIPVKSLDVPLPVTADTTAMSQPHEIEYTLTFDSDTLREAGS